MNCKILISSSLAFQLTTQLAYASTRKESTLFSVQPLEYIPINTVEFNYSKVLGNNVLEGHSVTYPMLFHFKPVVSFGTKNCEKKLFTFLFSVILLLWWLLSLLLHMSVVLHADFKAFYYKIIRNTLL